MTEADLIRFVNAQAEVYSQVISAAGCMARPYEIERFTGESLHHDESRKTSRMVQRAVASVADRQHRN